MTVLSAIVSAGCILWLGLVAYGAYSLWVTRNDAINKALDERAACMERHPSNHDPDDAIHREQAAWIEHAAHMFNNLDADPQALRDYAAAATAARHAPTLLAELEQWRREQPFDIEQEGL